MGSNERGGDLSFVEYIIYIHFCDQLQYFPGVGLASSNIPVAYCANLPCIMTGKCEARHVQSSIYKGKKYYHGVSDISEFSCCSIC